MKHYAWLGLAAAMILSWSAFAQEGGSKAKSPEQELELQERRLALKERELDMEFQQKVRQLELQKRETAVQRGGDDDKYARRLRRCRYYGFKAFLLISFIVNILLAIWVFQDIRQRNTGSGIWIVVTLLAGWLGAILYVLVRLGDMHKEK